MIFYKFVWCYYPLRIFPSSTFHYQTTQGYKFICSRPFAMPVTFLILWSPFSGRICFKHWSVYYSSGYCKLHFLYPTISSPHKPSIFYTIPLLVHFHTEYTTTTTKPLQSCPTLCDPIDSSPPGSPVPGTLQARTLERVAISFSNAWQWKVIVKSLSHVQLFVTPWTAAY